MPLRAGDPNSTFIDVDFTRFPLSTNTNSGTLSGSLDTYGLVFVRPSPATVKTSQEVVATGIPNNVIRIGTSGSQGSNFLVFEETRRNYVSSSRNATSTGWNGGIMSVTASMAAGPDGTVTSTRFNRTGSNAFSSYINNISPYTGERWAATMWMKSPSATQYSVRPSIASNVITVIGVTASWAKVELTGTYGGSDNYFQFQNGNNTTTTSFDVDMMQYERGLFPTEHIWTSGSQQSRASEKLYHPDVTQLIDDGMLAVEIAFRPKGHFPNQYTGPIRLWTIDENNYSELDPTGSLGRVCINGVTATFSPATIEMTKGFSIYTFFSTKPSETPQYVAISSSSTGFGTTVVGPYMSAGFSDLRLPSTLTGSLYFMSDASGNKTLSAWIERISVYRRSRNVPDLELPATRHPTYTRTTKVRPFADRTKR